MRTFRVAVAEAAKTAKKEAKIAYVYGENGEFLVGVEYTETWLVRIWPGGRSEASMSGKALVEKEISSGTE